jgi:hypothetical protein
MYPRFISFMISPKEASISAAGNGGNGAAVPFKLVPQMYGINVKDQSSLDEPSVSFAHAAGILNTKIQNRLNTLAI